MSLAALCLLAAIQTHTYQVEGMTSPPRFDHATVNQEIKVFQKDEAWFVSVAPRATSPTRSTRKVEGLLRALPNRDSASCVDLAGHLCERVREAGFSCREVAGLLYIHKVPARYAHLYVPRLGGIPHRWVEFFDPEQGWVAIDPTQEDGRISGLHLPIPVTAHWPDIRVEEVPWD